MLTRALIPLLAAGTALVGVAHADLLPSQNLITITQGVPFSLNLTDDDPLAVEVAMSGTLPVGLTVVDATTQPKISGTTPVGGNTGLWVLEVTSYKAPGWQGGSPLNSKFYRLTVEAPPPAPVGCHTPEGQSSRFVFRYRGTGVLPC